MGIDKSKRCMATRNDDGQCRNWAAWNIGGEYYCQAHAGAKALVVLQREGKAEEL